jgi:hypothetical protein
MDVAIFKILLCTGVSSPHSRGGLWECIGTSHVLQKYRCILVKSLARQTGSPPTFRLACRQCHLYNQLFSLIECLWYCGY